MCKLCSAKLSKNPKIITKNLLYVYSESDVDVTGVTGVNVNDSCYLLASDPVIFLFLKSVHKTSKIQLIKIL